MRSTHKKRICRRLLVLVAVFLAFLAGMKANAVVFQKAVKPEKTEDIEKYAADFREAAKLLSLNTLAVSELADSVSNTWIKALALGENSDQQVEKVFAELEKNGQKAKLERDNEKIEEAIKRLGKDYPFRFREAYKVLEDAYTQYAEFYKFSLAPSGSLVIFNKKIKETEAELARSFSRLNLYNPDAESPVRLAVAPPSEKGEQKDLAEGRKNTIPAAGLEAIFGKDLAQVENMLGAPLEENSSDHTGSVQRLYSLKGKKISVFFRNGAVSGWSE